jgi:tetratricopeptide (TPR) repeat protein
MRKNSYPLFSRLQFALLGCLCLWATLIPIPGSSFAQSEPQKDGRYYEGVARKAYQARDYPTFLENMKVAAQLRPNHPRVTYNLAIAYALNGQRNEALSWLDKIARMGLVARASDDADFDSIKDSAEFKAIVARIEANKLPLGKSVPAFTVHEKGIVPESVAFDPVTRTFYLSSIYKRKILRITEKGEVRDFATEADGLWSVFGMRVDARRRVLWACTASHPQMSNYNAAENGTSAILKFDLQSGKLVKKYFVPAKAGRHLLGDLVLNSSGDVFASDSLSAAIYVIRQGTDEMDLFVESPSFGSPQGLAFSADEKNLFMADYSNGIFLINLATKKIMNYPAPIDGTLLGIDGLYSYRGSLIGVQNGVNPQRIVRLSVKSDLTRIERVETIAANNPAFDEPTLGVLVKDTFYFIANSQWESIDDKGQLAPDEKLKEPVVLKVKLTD